MPQLARIPGVLLRIHWDGPAEAAGDWRLPTAEAAARRSAELLQLLARMLLLDAPSTPTTRSGWGESLFACPMLQWCSAYGPAPATSDCSAAL
jgi:hypothetical protein